MAEGNFVVNVDENDVAIPYLTKEQFSALVSKVNDLALQGYSKAQVRNLLGKFQLQFVDAYHLDLELCDQSGRYWAEAFNYPTVGTNVLAPCDVPWESLHEVTFCGYFTVDLRKVGEDEEDCRRPNFEGLPEMRL